jgi:hypothetical protein
VNQAPAGNKTTPTPPTATATATTTTTTCGGLSILESLLGEPVK